MLPRLSDVPTAVKVSLAPGFAILMMAGIALCALWSQTHSTAALYRVMDQGQLQLRLAADSRSITAANGALYTLMTRQAAGGSPDAAQASVGQVLAQLDLVKADLTALRTTLPPNLQPPINAVLRDLTLYRGGVTVVGSMLGIDFNSAASFLQPFQTNYTRMTSTLARASDEISAQAFASAAASSAEASHLGRLMLAAVALTLVAVILVSWLVVTLIARTIAGISSATERLAGGQTDLDLESMQRRDDFGPIVRSLSVFQTNQRHMIAMRAEQEAMKEREEAARAAAEREREDSMAQLRSVIAAMSLGLNNLAKGNLIFRLQEWFPLPFKGLRMDFNEANEKLRVTMDAIAQNTSGIRTSADEITQASDDLARRTEQQAATLEQTAAALDEITATVRRTADGAAEAREVVRAARSDAEHSGTIVREAVAAMSGIEASSMKIANIVGVIDDIAFQTNLLALNAGVEAARAGDAGRGFAVVATEVRALSQRSADAAKEIKALISASGQQVETGVKRVGDTGTSLTRIVERVERLNVLVAAIAGSAQEQATGLAEVNGAINQMDKVTQQNAAMVEQTTAASHALASEAKELARLVGQFSTSSAQPKDAAQQTKQNAFAT